MYLYQRGNLTAFTIDFSSQVLEGSKRVGRQRTWKDMAASLSCWSNCISASCMLIFATNRAIHFVCAALSIKSRIESNVLR